MDFIWYCVIHNLDYNILLPYSKSLEQLKEASFYNPNRDILIVSYDDNIFKENQSKIERISLKYKTKKTENHKFEKLEKCNKVITVELLGINEVNNELNNSFEIKENA